MNAARAAPTPSIKIVLLLFFLSIKKKSYNTQGVKFVKSNIGFYFMVIFMIISVTCKLCAGEGAGRRRRR